MQDAIDYLTWTFCFRRILVNPTYYELEKVTSKEVNRFLSTIVEDTLQGRERERVCVCVCVCVCACMCVESALKY